MKCTSFFSVCLNLALLSTTMMVAAATAAPGKGHQHRQHAHGQAVSPGLESVHFGEFDGNGHDSPTVEYYMSRAKRSWAEAHHICRVETECMGDLLQISSAEQDRVLNSLITDYDDSKLGGKLWTAGVVQSKRTWSWKLGHSHTPLSYQHKDLGDTPEAYLTVTPTGSPMFKWGATSNGDEQHHFVFQIVTDSGKAPGCDSD